MQEKEVLDILQNYRHDLMNDLQVVHGYLSMAKAESAKNKLNECLSNYNEERKLLSLGAAKFALWVIQFNKMYDHLHLNYQIHIENKQLHMADEQLITQCTAIIEKINSLYRSKDRLEINLQLEACQDPAQIEVTIMVNDDCYMLEEQNIKDIYMEQETETYVFETSPDDFVFRFPVLCDMRGEK